MVPFKRERSRNRLRAGIKVAHRGMKRLTPGDSVNLVIGNDEHGNSGREQQSSATREKRLKEEEEEKRGEGGREERKEKKGVEEEEKKIGGRRQGVEKGRRETSGWKTRRKRRGVQGWVNRIERRERDRRSLFDASAQRVVEITQAGEITFSFCPRLGQRQEKKKRGTVGARKNTSLKRWTWNKKERRNEARTLLILPRNDSMKGVVLGGVVRKDGRGEGERNGVHTRYIWSIEISGMDPSIALTLVRRDKWNEGGYPCCFSIFPIDRWDSLPSFLLFFLFLPFFLLS